MRTGIFAFLSSKKQKDSKGNFSFGETVLKAVKDSKGTTEEELAVEMKGVLDSMSELKDCEAKDTLLDVVKDCFDNKEKAIANESELTKTLDSMWIDIHGDSLKEIAKAFTKLSDKTAETPATDTQNKDSEEKEDKENKENKDSEDKEDKENKDSEDKENKDSEDKENKDSEDKGKDGCNKDSVPVMTKDDVITAIKDALPELVQKAVKDVLGIKDDAKPQVDGGMVDNQGYEENPARDYTSFLE